VAVALLLGAEEFGFATAPLVAMGCRMMRVCHLGTCPFGVATQNPELRKRFAGKPEYILNFLRFVAEEARRHLAQLGLRSLAEARGRSDLLEIRPDIPDGKARLLDFSDLLKAMPQEAAPMATATEDAIADFDRRVLLPALKLDGKHEALRATVTNADRSVGTALSGVLAERFGEKGQPEDTVVLHLEGTAGQSLGAFLAPGVTIDLCGAANDYVGKGLSGGKIILRPPTGAHFNASENVIAGNVIGYGGTSGRIFLDGTAGERFAIRNSGMTLVAEGVGDHGCEYMTGGRVVILGKVGVNFAAGMTGGVAYVYDENGDFDLSCNPDDVDLGSIEPDSDDERDLKALILAHLDATGSARAAEMLRHWETHRPRFVRVTPAAG
jgi:glutamate synthase (NADPH/NADH) large chain